MARSIYVTSVESYSGKSMVSLGIMEMLSRHVDRVGYFRPVIGHGSQADPRIELMRHRYQLQQSYEHSFGVTTDETRTIGSRAEAEPIVAKILTAFDELSQQCDMVLVEGSDYTGASSAFEFELNQLLAANLGSPIVLVASALNHRPEQVHGAVHGAVGRLRGAGLSVIGCVINRIRPEDIDEITGTMSDELPVWFMPQEPILDRPNMAQIAKALGARVLIGDDESLLREITTIKVAAMHIPSLLDRIETNTLLITSGDRADVLLTGLASQFSDAGPSVAGVLLTGGLMPAESVMAFARGMKGRIPVLLSEQDTFATAELISGLQPDIGPHDDKKITTALGVFESHVDTTELANLIDVSESDVLTPMMFEHRLLRRARADRRRIVLPEGSDDRVLTAADRLLKREVCDLTILGDLTSIKDRAQTLDLDLSAAELIDPNASAHRDAFAREILELRKHKGMTAEVAHDLAADVSMFGTMLVHHGMVDGMVSGAVHTTADTIRPALQVIRTLPGVSIVSSVFLMCLADRVLVYGDCAVNPDPNPAQLADIAISSAKTARAFGIEPYVAMLSYSTGASGTGGDVDKVREATAIARERAPELPIEGPIQYDAAVDMVVAASKLPDSQVAGRATVFVFPDLNTGNNTYKAVQRSAAAVAIGPVLQGLRKPVNDLSRGCTVADIVNTVAITAVQAQTIIQGSGP